MEKIAISFSGGRSSAVMTQLVLQKYPDAEIEITFANTGFEHEDTLRFVNDCDRHLFGGRVVWIEYKQPGGRLTDGQEREIARFRSYGAEAKHRHNWPFFCTRNNRFAAFMDKYHPRDPLLRD